MQKKMRDEFGKPHTAHTTNLVPVVVTKKASHYAVVGLYRHRTNDVRHPGVAQPKEMTGKSLIIKA